MNIIEENTPTNVTNESYENIINDAMQYQAIFNVGVIGHVANGKSTLTKNLTGVVTQKRKEELQKNMSIRLGYANTKIYKCSCDEPKCYQSTSSNVMNYKCKVCGDDAKLITHISITDVPGHNSLMSTMLNGTCVMDKTILVESCSNDENIPAPQTVEHFKITKEIGVETILICLNKVDLIINKKGSDHEKKEKIMGLITKLRMSFGKHLQVVPICASISTPETSNLKEDNFDVICEYLAKIEIPKKDLTSNFKMLVVRSFNCNHPNTRICDLKGGILGGSLTRGIIKIGDEVLVYPGFISRREKKKEFDPEWSYIPFNCKVISLNSEKNSLTYAIPGGFVGVQLDIDPGVAYDDHSAGQVMFKKDNDMSNVKVYEAIKVKYTKLEGEHNKLIKGDKLLINVNANEVNCTIYKIKEDKQNLMLKLEKPICVELNDKITIILPLGGTNIHIFGYGNIIDGANCILSN